MPDLAAPWFPFVERQHHDRQISFHEIPAVQRCLDSPVRVRQHQLSITASVMSNSSMFTQPRPGMVSLIAILLTHERIACPTSTSNITELNRPRKSVWKVGNNLTSIIIVTVSQKKLCKRIFVRTLSNLDRLWKFLAQGWQRQQAFLRCAHFPPHLIYVNALPC